MNKGTPADPLPAWEDPRVQIVYTLLCADEAPPDREEHWEGWIARRIVAALATKPAETADGGMPTMESDAVDTLTEEGWTWDGDQWQRPSHPTESAGKSPEAVIALLLKTCRQAFYALKGREHDQFLRDAIKHAEAWVLANHEATCLAETQRSSNATRSDEQTSPTVQPPAPEPLREAAEIALDVWDDGARSWDQRTYVQGTFAEAMEKLRAALTPPSIAQRGAAPEPWRKRVDEK